MPAQKAGFFVSTSMKTLFCVVLIALLLRPDAKALFGHTAAEKERRIETEQQLARQEQANGQLIHSNERFTSSSAFCPLVLWSCSSGAAIGSKTRRDHGANS